MHGPIRRLCAIVEVPGEQQDNHQKLGNDVQHGGSFLPFAHGYRIRAAVIIGRPANSVLTGPEQSPAAANRAAI
jgi:hypothetical protein